MRGATGYTPTAATFDLVLGLASFAEPISADSACRVSVGGIR